MEALREAKSWAGGRDYLLPMSTESSPASHALLDWDCTRTFSNQSTLIWPTWQRPWKTRNPLAGTERHLKVWPGPSSATTEHPCGCHDLVSAGGVSPWQPAFTNFRSGDSRRSASGLGGEWPEARLPAELGDPRVEAPADFEAVSGLDRRRHRGPVDPSQGLGRWTVQMHLMFALNRPDVFPVDDLGIRRAMERHFGLEVDGPKAQYEKRARIWGPFRTAASRFLWMSLDNQPK